MATPVTFPESNFVWTGPSADIGDLPAYRDTVNQETISCWELTEDELAEVARTGRVWLSVWYRHPPVTVGGHNPFAPSPG